MSSQEARMSRLIIRISSVATATVVLYVPLGAQNTPRILLAHSELGARGHQQSQADREWRRFGNPGQGVVVRWNGQNLQTTYVSDTQLTVTLPALGIGGTAQVTVFLPLGAGELSAPAPFTINNPPAQVIKLPTGLAAGAAVNLSVIGSFVRGAALHWNGAARPTMYVNANQVTASLSSTDLVPGTYSVTVVNPTPGGGASSPRSVSVVEPAVITALSIGGSNNPERVWAGQAVPLNITRTGGTPTHWKVATSVTALVTTPWQTTASTPTYTFQPWRANDCGLLDTSYRRTSELHFQYATVAGADTIRSPSSSDEVIVRLPWCSPLSTGLPPAFAGILTSSVGASHCSAGKVMNGIRVRTFQQFSWMPTIVTAIGAICAGIDRAMIGAPDGAITLDTNFGSNSLPTIHVFPHSQGGLKSIAVLPAPLPIWLNGQPSFDPLYARVVNGVVSGTGSPWQANCPSDAVPIAMDVYRASDSRAVGLSLVCARPDK
jgi:hypothetical protein